jgi:hypothetical protein
MLSNIRQLVSARQVDTADVQIERHPFDSDKQNDLDAPKNHSSSFTHTQV